MLKQCDSVCMLRWCRLFDTWSTRSCNALEAGHLFLQAADPPAVVTNTNFCGGSVNSSGGSEQQPESRASHSTPARATAVPQHFSGACATCEQQPVARGPDSTRVRATAGLQQFSDGCEQRPEARGAHLTRGRAKARPQHSSVDSEQQPVPGSARGRAKARPQHSSCLLYTSPSPRD